MTKIIRETRETRVSAAIDVTTPGAIATSIPFLDHMVTTLARYSGLALRVTASGDLAHHVSEDVAIAIGALVAARCPVNAARYGDRTVPMDDALVHCALDLGGRAFYRGPLPATRYEHWMRSFAEHAGAAVHLRVLRGTDRHHIVEAAFKALGLALRDALVCVDDGAFSTKGAVSFEVTP